MSAALQPRGDEEFVRGRPIPPQGEGGYDQNWYPICLSAEVAPGTYIGSEFMNGRVLVFRDSRGRAQVLSAYCRHIGADLTRGSEVVEDCVRCPYHYWRYDITGQCVATGLGDKPPSRAKLFRFPTEEAFGFIWAFNGLEPLYALPHFPVPESELALMIAFDKELPVDHFVPFSNSSDIQHLKAVHKIDLRVNPEAVDVTAHGMTYDQEMNIPGMGEMTQRVRIFGTNCLYFLARFAGRQVYQMSAGKPLPGNRTLASMIIATPKSTGAPGEEELVRGVLEQGMKFGRQLFEEDDIVLQNIRFRQDNLTGSDRMLNIYFNYVRNYPRSDIACDLIA
jgi:phenylpropionate dioxygenase-like ring-hydroxylating dioxygenase large terminal subunit